MRNPIVSTILLFASLTVSAETTAQDGAADNRGILEIISDRNVHRSLPSGTIIGGNLIKAESWYILSASEISAVRTLLQGERFVVTEELPVQLPLPIYTVVLWGVTDGNVVPLNVLGIDRSVSTLRPRDDKAGWYGVPDGSERECLRRLIKRIQEGKEQPVVQRPEQGKGTPAGQRVKRKN